MFEKKVYEIILTVKKGNVLFETKLDAKDFQELLKTAIMYLKMMLLAMWDTTRKIFI